MGDYLLQSFQSARGVRQLQIFTERNLDVETVCLCVCVWMYKFSFSHYPLCVCVCVYVCDACVCVLMFSCVCQVGSGFGLHGIPGCEHPTLVITVVTAACQVV